MRTTLTLDDDVAALVREQMGVRGASLKDVVNDSLRAALSPPSNRELYRVPVVDMGEPSIPLDNALALAAELEDEELLRKVALRK